MSNEKPITIIVNGRPKEFSQKKISFEQVIILAFGTYDASQNAVYTVIYSKNKNKNGVLLFGEDTVVHEGAIFNVTRTDKS